MVCMQGNEGIWKHIVTSEIYINDSIEHFYGKTLFLQACTIVFKSSIFMSM